MNSLKVFYNSFFRTLCRIIFYILLGLVFSTILSKIDVHADSIKGVYSHGYINGTSSFLSGMDEGNFSNYKSLSPGVEPTVNLAIEDFTLSSENYLVVMTYCSTTTNYINVVTPQYDVTNAKLTGNYGTNNNLGLCSVGQYTGALFQGVFGVSKLPNYESFQLRIWGGTSYNYNTFVQIVDVSLYYDTPEIRNSFINNINSNKFIDNQNQINNKLNDINGSINNDNVDDPSSSINSFKDKIASNGVITQLIGLPVTLFTKVLNSVNGTCSTYNLGSLFGIDLILPCVNIQNYLGTSLWSIIDVLISGLFVYSISRKFIKVFESMSSMNEGDVIGD